MKSTILSRIPTIIAAVALTISLLARSSGAEALSLPLSNGSTDKTADSAAQHSSLGVQGNKTDDELSKERAKLEQLRKQLQTILAKTTPSNPTTRLQATLNEIKQPRKVHRDDWLPPPRDRLSISKGLDARRQMLYSIDATEVKLYDVTRALAEAANAKLIIDSDISDAQLSSLVSVYLKKTLFADALGIILGMEGLEFTLNTSKTIPVDDPRVYFESKLRGRPDEREVMPQRRGFDEILVTLPTSLDFDSPSEYFERKAVDTYERALVEDIVSPYVPKAYFELGNYYLRSDAPQIAVQEFQAVLKDYPDTEFARMALYNSGECFSELGDHEEARRAYFNFIDKYVGDPLTDEAYLAVAETYIAQKQYEQAIRMCEIIVDEHSESNSAPTAQFKLALVYFNTQRFGKARREFTKLRTNYPRCEYAVEAAYQIANCLYLQQDFPKACAAFNTFLTRNSINAFSAKAYFRLADCFYELSSPTVPDREPRLQASQADPKFVGNSKIVASLEAYNGAVKMFPNSSLAPYGFYRIGKCLQKLGLHEEAIRRLREGILKHSESNYADRMKMEIGRCYFEMANFDQAFKISEELTGIVEVGQLAAEANMMAGNCLYQEKDYQRAIVFYNKAATIGAAAETQEAYKRIGDCYQKLKRFEEAARAYLSVP